MSARTDHATAPPRTTARAHRVSRRPLAYAIAVAIVVAAAAATWAIALVVGRPVLVMLVVGAAGAAWFGGIGPGVLAAILSAIAYDYFFLPPPGALSAMSADTLTELGVLASVAVLAAWVSDRLAAARAASERGASETALLTAQLQDRSEELELLLEETQSASEELEQSNQQLGEAMAAAEEAEQRIRTILESVSDAFIALDAELRFIYLNRRAAEVLRGSSQAPPESLIGCHLLDVVPRYHGSRFETEIRRVLAERRPTTFVMQREGREEWSEVRCYPAPDGGLTISWSDVTERQRSERLRSMLAAIVESSDDAIVGKSLDGIILSWNAGAERIFGWTAAEAVGRSIEDLIIPPERRDEEPRILARLYQGEHVDHFETVRVRKDGTRVDVSVTISVVRDGDGRVVSASKIARDITRQKRLARAQRFVVDVNTVLGSSLDYEATLASLARLVVPHLADWCTVHVVDEHGKPRQLAVAHADPDKVRWARELERRYPPDLETPIGVPQVLRTGRPELHPEITPQMVDRAAKSEEHRRMLHDVGLRSAIVVPLVARGRVLGALTLVSAESGRRYDAEDLALAEEVGRRAGLAVDNALLYQAEQRARAEAEAARADAEAANLAKTDFLATMSHELRTPLNAIAGYAELLAIGVRGPITPEQRQDLARIQRSQRHLLSLINDVLNFARIESGHLDLRLTDVPLDEALGELEALIRPQVEEKHLEYRYEPAGAAHTVHADREKLEQIVLNLLSNAIKFTPTGGRIVVSSEVRGDDVTVISVADNGRGIPPDKLRAIFDPFVQVERSLNRPSEGTGLGLAISRDLARAMGGDITVESVNGKGSTFSLTLPRTAKPPIAREGAGAG